MGDQGLLAPLLRKLAVHVTFTSAEQGALLNLPYRVKSVSRDAYLSREGVRSDHVVLLLSGIAYQQKWTGAGAKQILALHVPGDLAAMSTAILPASDHDVRALNPITVAEIPRDAFSEAARRFPAIAQALWVRAMIDTAISREWIVNIARRNVRQRIAHLLCELVYRFEANGVGSPEDFACPLTQDHIADSIGATSVHVNRTLKAMRIEGLVQSTRQALTIPDLPALQKIGEFNPAYLYLSTRPR